MLIMYKHRYIAYMYIKDIIGKLDYVSIESFTRGA